LKLATNRIYQVWGLVASHQRTILLYLMLLKLIVYLVILNQFQ
jgi:hypothetical protein